MARTRATRKLGHRLLRRRFFQRGTNDYFPKEHSLKVFAEAVYSDKIPKGYELLTDKQGIKVYRRGSHYVIAHRGTTLSSKDLVTDLELGFGRKGKLFEERQAMTERLVLSI